MKHLQKFENFSIQVNENIFQDGFNAIKSKISQLKNSKIISSFNQGLDFVENNPNDPKVMELVTAIDNLPDSEKAKINAITIDPNSIYNRAMAESDGMQEAALSSVKENINKYVLKLLGFGSIGGSVINLIGAIMKTTFPTAGSVYNMPTSHLGGPTMATLFLMIGILVGGYLLAKADENK